MANTINTYFSSVFTDAQLNTTEQLNNIPRLPRYVGNTFNTFNFRLEDVQERVRETEPSQRVHDQRAFMTFYIQGSCDPGRHALWTPQPYLQQISRNRNNLEIGTFANLNFITHQEHIFFKFYFIFKLIVNI